MRNGPARGGVYASEMKSPPLVLLAALTACADLPRDPDGTLERVTRERRFRVGIVSSGGDAAAAERQRALIARIAAATGARPTIAHDSAEPLLVRLEDGALDLVVGEFLRDGPWSTRVHMLPALARTATAGGETVVAGAARHGENRWIMLVDREAEEIRSAVTPSRRMLSEMIPAATASAHHRPKPIPSTPATPASPVIQSAFCIIASVRPAGSG